MNKDIKLIADFWKNIEIYAENKERLINEFEEHFLNDFIEHSRIWKEELSIINGDIEKYLNAKKTIKISGNKELKFDNFVKLFLQEGKKVIDLFGNIASKDMDIILENVIKNHLETLDYKFNNDAIKFQKPINLNESIKTLKIF